MTSNGFRPLARGALALLLIGSCALAWSQTQQVYRYVDPDGRVVYSDKPPPADARDAQAKRIGRNTIETSSLSYAAAQAQERFPVTLYSFDCGEVCRQGEALLNRRGVPYSGVNVETPEGAEQLSKMTGELRAPVLQVGDRTFIKGYSEAQWNKALDEAGYPKAPAPRTTVAGRAPPPEATTATAAATNEARTVNLPTPYPKQ